MGMPDMPKAAPAPVAPEPVKHLEEDVLKVQDDARRRAIARFGVVGTDRTGGQLAGAPDVKTKKLGG